MDKHTPGYLVRLETKREKLEIKASTRAVKYKEKMRFWRSDTPKEECLRSLQRINVRSDMEREKKILRIKSMVQRWNHNKDSHRRFDMARYRDKK